MGLCYWGLLTSFPMKSPRGGSSTVFPAIGMILLWDSISGDCVGRVLPTL